MLESAEEINVKFIRIAMWLLMFGWTLSSHADSIVDAPDQAGLGLYEWFETDGVFSQDLPADVANAIVAQALSSGNDTLIRHAVDGMMWYSIVENGSYEKYLKSKFPKELPSRAFHRVPKLKNFLIGYTREGFRRDGPVIRFVERDGRLRYNAWLQGSELLAHLFPNDLEVHDLIFEVHSKENTATTLQLLSSGKFRTERANRFRIESLSLGRTSAILAAEALGEFRTPEGLLALENALNLKHPAVHQLAKSLMAYERSPELDTSLRTFAKTAINYPKQSFVGQAGEAIFVGMAQD